MTIAFVCPDSFTDYEVVEKELLKNEDITKIICATTNANRLAEVYTLHNNCEIKTWLVKDGGKEKRLRTMIERADKIILFEFTDYDENKTKYSRTQYALKYTKKLEKNLHILNYNREGLRMESATALFRERRITHNDNFRHAESRWSALAQMVFIWMSKQDNKFVLNVYKSQYKKDKKHWLKEDSDFNITNWDVSNSIVEGNIADLLKDSRVNDALKNKEIIKEPDLVLIDKKNKNTTNITIIEVKTVGAGVSNNVNKYRELVRLIDAMDCYTCELYYLMSYGHEDKTFLDWKLLEDDKANIILWEELFLKMKQDDCPLLEYITPLGNIDNWLEYIDERFTNTDDTI